MPKFLLRLLYQIQSGRCLLTAFHTCSKFLRLSRLLGSVRSCQFKQGLTFAFGLGSQAQRVADVDDVARGRSLILLE